MGISIIISHKQDGVLNTDYFVEQLKKRWEDVNIHFISVPKAPILQFSIPNPQNPYHPLILGDFSGTGISYKSFSRIEDVQVALWYRSIVPTEWALLLYDSALTFDMVSLTPHTVADEILAGFDIPFDESKYE